MRIRDGYKRGQAVEQLGTADDPNELADTVVIIESTGIISREQEMKGTRWTDHKQQPHQVTTNDTISLVTRNLPLNARVHDSFFFLFCPFLGCLPSRSSRSFESLQAG